MKKLSFSYVVKRISRVYDSCQSFRSLQMADKYCSLLSKAFKGSQIDLARNAVRERTLLIDEESPLW